MVKIRQDSIFYVSKAAVVLQMFLIQKNPLKRNLKVFFLQYKVKFTGLLNLREGEKAQKLWIFCLICKNNPFLALLVELFS